MSKTIRIGIDFGTTYSFAGYVHGDFVMPLIPSRENYGIPSVFYADKNGKMVGRQAAANAAKHPENAVRSVKRKLKEEVVLQANGVSYTPEMVVQEIIGYVVDCAETQLQTAFLEDYDRIEAVITVPVNFSEPMKNLIRQAASKVRLRNGKQLSISGIIPEPVAAAIEYFGLRKEQDANILVFDLGGGTFDTALVRANATGAVPYSVKAQDGDSELGGDEWDRVLANWIADQYRKQIGGRITPQMDALFLQEGRKIKEDLTEQETVVTSIPIKGDDLEVSITRSEFEVMTRHLLNRALDKVRDLVRSHPDVKIDHVIMTGGSSYMPQVRQGLINSGIFSPGTDILLTAPERAIAHGAARYAATRVVDSIGEVKQEKKLVDLITSHSYGIVYVHVELNYKELVYIIIPKGAKLPFTAKSASHTIRENQINSLFRVYESDYAGKEGVDIELSEGHEIMSVTLQRNEKKVPKGRQMESVLTITEDEMLHITSVDLVSGIKKSNSVSIKRNIK